MSRHLVQASLATALAASGTLAVAYPSGTSAGTFVGAVGHRFVTNPANDVFKAPDHFTLAFGASSITLTWGSASPTIPAGTAYVLQLETAGAGPMVTDDNVLVRPLRSADLASKFVNFGAPIAADADGLVATLAVADTDDIVMDGDLVGDDGIAVLDVPRNISVDSDSTVDTTQSIDVWGEDEYGNEMSETIALNGTTAVVGDKAFKTVTRMNASAALTGNLIAGTGTKLGFPVFVPFSGAVRTRYESGSVVTNGTLVAGDTGAQSATSGDVRGTWAPNTAPDGTVTYSAVVDVMDPAFLGVDQYVKDE